MCAISQIKNSQIGQFFCSARTGQEQGKAGFLGTAWGFTIKILQWEKFLEGHHFITSNSIGTFKVDTKKMDHHAFVNGAKPTKDRVKIDMIRIGVLDDHSHRKIETLNDSDGKMIVTPP